MKSTARSLRFSHCRAGLDRLIVQTIMMYVMTVPSLHLLSPIRSYMNRPSQTDCSKHTMHDLASCFHYVLMYSWRRFLHLHHHLRCPLQLRPYLLVYLPTRASSTIHPILMVGRSWPKAAWSRGEESWLRIPLPSQLMSISAGR